jgi:hypothetical protein
MPFRPTSSPLSIDSGRSGLVVEMRVNDGSCKCWNCVDLPTRYATRCISAVNWLESILQCSLVSRRQRYFCVPSRKKLSAFRVRKGARLIAWLLVFLLERSAPGAYMALQRTPFSVKSVGLGSLPVKVAVKPTLTIPFEAIVPL